MLEESFEVEALRTPFPTELEFMELSFADLEKYDNSSILVLPSRIDQAHICFAQETSDFIKYSKMSHSEISIVPFSNKDDLEIISLHSFDIWMPIFFIAKNIMLPLFIGLLIEYVKQRLKGRETETCQVHIEIIIEREGEYKRIRYNGSANAFNKKFENIDISRL